LNSGCREKISIDNDFNHQNDQSWCLQILFDEKNSTKVLFHLLIA
jgi:hypothetical protein